MPQTDYGQWTDGRGMNFDSMSYADTNKNAEIKMVEK